MNKLFCYGITRRALQLLSPDSPSEIPNAWFNWLNQNLGGTAIERLTLIDPDSSAAKVLNWNRNAKKAGYACVLIYSTEDPSQHTDHAKTLSEDVVLHPISHMPIRSERDGQFEVLSLLREPENFFINGWAMVRGGGGVSIDKRGLADVPPAHWWAYGIGLKKWINRTAKGQPDSVHRNNCPDYAPWNHMKAIGLEYPDTKLSIQKCWNSPQSDFWHWSLSNPCTPTDIPAMSLDGFVAYYPMRQMPCCGVAVTESGELVPIGALPDEKDARGWVWADEKANAAFQAIAREVVAQKVHDGSASTRGRPEPTSNTGVITKVVSTSGAANDGQFRMYAADRPIPIPELNVQWHQNFGGQSATCRLITEGTNVFFECNSMLSAGKPNLTKLHSLWKANEEWALERKDGRWLVSKLTWTDFNSRLRTLFPNGPNGENRFLERGYFVC